ncbi:MAG: dihydrofolate reductase [Hyphomicrobiales bacterium]|nr:dihydrofolate reductase [Hyphomicrobiales bacterium]MBV8662550.1 dihydrofolate reductase [Hyphomicrobiales bacterium]
MSGPAVVLVAAVARNGAIGADNALLWRLPSDLKRFKALTMGKPLIMGRKTFDSIGRPLPGRETIVVTRDAEYARDGVAVAHDVDSALRLGAERARAAGVDEVIVAGGGEIYAQTIDRAGRLYVTEVDLAPEGDARFPAIDPAIWREVAREQGVRGPNDEANFVFVTYERAAGR